MCACIHSFTFSSKNVSWAPTLHPDTLSCPQDGSGPALECGARNPQRAPHKPWSVPMATQYCDLFQQRMSPLEWTPLKTCSGMPLWAPSSGHPLPSSMRSSLWPRQVSAQNRELALVVYISLSPEKNLRQPGEVVDGGEERTISQKWPENKMPFFAYQIKDQDHST